MHTLKLCMDIHVMSYKFIWSWSSTLTFWYKKNLPNGLFINSFLLILLLLFIGYLVERYRQTGTGILIFNMLYFKDNYSLISNLDNVFFFPSIFCISFLGQEVITMQGRQDARSIKMKFFEAFMVSSIIKHNNKWLCM